MGDTRQNRCHRISLERSGSSWSAFARGSTPHFCMVAAAISALAGGSASADPAGTTPTSAAVGNARLPLQADHDGTYVHLGPTAAAVRRAGDWDTVVGGALSLLRVREDDALAVIGGRITGARWTEAHGGRVTFEAVAGASLGVIVGVAAGPLVDLGDLHHPRIGGSATIWCYAGVVPYLRVGVLDTSGGFVEAGVEIPLPVFRWRHR
jgi:hypothetical protein